MNFTPQRDDERKKMLANSSETAPKIVIIGGVAGGASAAAKARRMNEAANIVVLEKGPYVSFANCGLPYHISGEIQDREELFVATPEFLHVRLNIDVRTNSEVKSISPEKRSVEVFEYTTGRSYEETYDKLIIATGAEPSKPPIPGIQTEGCFTLKTIADMDAIVSYLDRQSVQSAIIIGAGFIGLEAAEALFALGLDVTVVEAAPQILPAWDPDMADIVERHLIDKLMIEVVKSDPVKEIHSKDDRVSGISLASGDELEAELVLLAIGIRPNTTLASGANIKLNREGLIEVDDHMRTSLPDIYAVGDAVETVHRVTGNPTWLPLAGPANRQGRVAGINAAGGDASFPGVIGTSVVRIGKLCAARTGLNVREAQQAGLNFFCTRTTGMSHAGYFPDAHDIDIKLIVEESTGRLLGAQAVGSDGVDKRIDILATSIVAGLSVRDIVNLELAYSPPYGSAKDPVNMAAMVAENTLDGITKPCTWDDVFHESPAPVILDVRSHDERKTLYVLKSKHIPVDELRARLEELNPEEPIRLYCRIGQRGYYCERLLSQSGFKNVMNISGGWRSLWGETRDDCLVGEEGD